MVRNVVPTFDVPSSSGSSRRGTLRISEVATTHELAFDQGVTTLRRRLSERQNRKWVLARRPKKYYVAKRLLASRHSTEQPEMAGARVWPVRRLARVGEPV
jgi:hypothetical protein